MKEAFSHIEETCKEENYTKTRSKVDIHLSGGDAGWTCVSKTALQFRARI